MDFGCRIFACIGKFAFIGTFAHTPTLDIYLHSMVFVYVENEHCNICEFYICA